MSDVIESILSSEDLPSPPGVVLRVLEIYDQPDFEVDDFVQIIGADPALTAKLIEYANSPLFGLSREVTTIKSAIVLIGMRAVKILALSFSLVKVVPSNESQFDYDRFWSQSIGMATIAKTVSLKTGGLGEQEFLLGLIMRIGRVGLVQEFADDYVAMLDQAIESGQSAYELETEKWGVHHLEVSLALLKHWNFPNVMVASIDEFGDRSGRNDWDTESMENKLLGQQMRVFKFSEKICDMLFDPNLDEDEVKATKKMAFEWFGFEDDQFAEMFDESTEAWSEFAKLLNFRAAEAQSFGELEKRARKGISELSMGLHAESVAVTEKNAELQHQATVDSLTGLKNRRAFEDDVKSEQERANRTHSSFALMMVDIDHFKNVNDTYGHGVGDQALVEVSECLVEQSRECNSVYRFGGEEFVIVVPECDSDQAAVAGERYRAGIEAMVIKTDQVDLTITASFGVVIYEPTETRSIEEMLEVADKLLYRAKKGGRNRVCVKTTSAIPAMNTGNSVASKTPASS